MTEEENERIPANLCIFICCDKDQVEDIHTIKLNKLYDVDSITIIYKIVPEEGAPMMNISYLEPGKTTPDDTTFHKIPKRTEANKIRWSDPKINNE